MKATGRKFHKGQKKLGYQFAVIPRDVIDSLAFADLNGEAIRTLLIAARQWNGQNNGHIQLTFTYCSKHGIGSQHTLKNAIASLIAHGFIYRTRSRGIQNGRNTWARYALTWESISKDRAGLFLDGFRANAWAEWAAPTTVLSGGKKCRIHSAKSAVSPIRNGAETALNPTAQNADYEYLAICNPKKLIQYHPVSPHLRAMLTKLNYRSHKRPRRNHARQVFSIDY